MDSKEFKQIRKQLKLTQDGMADLLEVSVRTIQGMEYGKQKISKVVSNFLNQKIHKEYPESIKMDVSDRNFISLAEMVEFCLQHSEIFEKTKGIKLLIEYNRNEAIRELLEKHLFLRENFKKS